MNRDGVKALVLDLYVFPEACIFVCVIANMKVNVNHYLKDSNGNTISLSSCRVIWWRRPQPLELHPEITDLSYRYIAMNECQQAISGLWLGLDVFWINHPIRTEQAASIPYQLKVAQRVGLEIPSTLITNNPEEVTQFVSQYGIENTVYKAFTATELNWRETRLFDPQELNLLDNLRFAPVIFQEYIPAQFDLRITIIGDDVFAASIYSQETSYKVDYRMDMHSARIEPYSLPMDPQERFKRLMNHLGLVYGAIEMMLTPEGRIIFLEINPAGQWMFIEEHTKQPITESFSKLLCRYDK